HASWLNQVEIYFGLVQRKVLTPAAATGLDLLARRIMGFEGQCRCRPKPFRWKFTSKDFRVRLSELAAA
ncbi:MAG TPA: IS630 family transposase, partial [Candidatus Dormibacteraeota bacterium]|nr:IS630 family transposase [Candidatus Dormibacteraeota bacterium]